MLWCFAEIVPVLLLAPLVGTLVDRVPRIRVMIGADLWRALLPASLVFVGENVAGIRDRVQDRRGAVSG